MSSLGIFDSVRIQTDLTACAKCGSTARIANGLCVSCMLEPALKGDGKGGESLAAALAEIDVRDADWRAGNYQILEEIGRGGMGVIYRARQRHSRRIVALKRVLSYHADSRETLARFRREAEAAASLDHPNILPIYEVSEGEDGLPFFSMKFAPGGSLLDAGPALRDEPRRSVALMAKVARAVQYAHGQGILHRDLKPGNILLDGHGEPLVSDFGLAKWLDTTSDVTRTLTIFGTPGYIAPEQARGPAAKLTSAADVYSLGAILFVLFTGRPPFLGEHALAVIQQAAEKPAPKLRSLAPALDRDLQTICARCLEREPQARYHSAADLADDLERWLEGKPIKARRVLPSTRTWRWSRRNPKLVGTAAACLFLGAASIWFLWQAGWLQQISIAAKKLLLSPQEAAEQSKLRQALVEYPDVDIEAQYLHLGWERDSQASVQERLYSELALRVGLDQKLLRDKLAKFAQQVKRNRATPLYDQASAAYLGEDYTESERLSLEAAEEAQKTGTARTTEVIEALNLAAWSACKSSDCDRALDHLREAEKLTDRQRDPKKWADTQFVTARVFLALAQTAEAEKRLEEVTYVRTRVYGPEDRQTLTARRLRAWAWLQLGKCAEAEREFRELVKLDERIFGPEHLETIWSHWDLTSALDGEYCYNDPKAYLVETRHVLKLREKVLGSEHPETLRTRAALCSGLAASGQYREAIAQRRDVLRLQQKILGPEDSGTLVNLENLGDDLAEIGDFAEAEATLRQALQLREKTLGAAHRVTLHCRAYLAMTLAAQNKGVQAEAEAREIVKLSDRSVGAQRSGWTRTILGVILDKEGHYAEAEAQIRQAVRLEEKALGPTDTMTRSHSGYLAKTLWYEAKNAEAASILGELIALNEKALGEKVYLLENNLSSHFFEELTPLECRTLLANTLRDQQKYAEAEAEYKKVIELEEKALGPEHRDTLNACYNYAYQLAQKGKRDEAKALAQRAAKGAARVLGPNNPNTREYEKFLDILEKDQPITIPYMKFHETFLSGKQT